MGKYKVIHRNDGICWQEACPIKVLAVQVSRDTQTGICFLQTKLANVSERQIDSIVMKVDLYFNTEHESVELKILDADLPAGKISTPGAIKIKLSEVNRSSAHIVRADEKESFGDSIFCDNPEPIVLDRALSDERTELLREEGGDADLCTGAPRSHGSWWQCGCGAINLKRSACWRCGSSFETQSKAVSIEALEASRMNRLYQKATMLMTSDQKDDVTEARALFKELATKGYIDSIENIAESENRLAEIDAIKEQRRKRTASIAGIVVAIVIAIVFLNRGLIINAIQSHSEATQLQSQISEASVGDIVAFGRPTSYMGSSNKSIKWIVLAKENGKALVISQSCVDKRAFGAESEDPEDAGYEGSGLYTYLNNSFKQDSFDEAQRSIMSGDILILDADTVEKYMPTDSSRVVSSKVKNIWGEGEEWWTSTNSTLEKLDIDMLDYYDDAAFVTIDGYGGIRRYGREDYAKSHRKNWEGLGVRPALWINL